MSRKILIIGGSGLLGSYFIKWCFENGYTQLTATYHQSKDRIPPDIKAGVNWQQLTLPDREKIYELVNGHDWVIHTGGFVSYNPRDKSKLLEINATATSHIVNACLACKTEHLIYVGSKSSLGREKDGQTLNEDAAWLDNEFSTNYGLSKYLGELEVWRGVAEGLNASVILPAVILGTGHWDRSSLQMIDRIAQGKKWYPGGTTGFVDVRDIVRFMALLLQQSNHGERWLLCGFNASYQEMYGSFADHFDVQVNFKQAPKWLGALLLSARSLFGISTLGIEMLNQAYGTFYYDASKSTGLEDFQYTPSSDSIKEITALYRNHSEWFLPF